MKVYFISGLGADRSIFKHVQLPRNCQAVYLDWIPPQPSETLPHYALRLAEKIDTTENFALIGLSFGGMLAAEIAKQLNPSFVVLVSSVPIHKHLPTYFHWAGALRLHKAVPLAFIKKMSLMKRLFTAETDDDKKMLKIMIRKIDMSFMRWAMNAILTWKNTELPVNVIHIHGTRDEVLPMRFVKPTHKIAKGGHLMILNRAAEINKILAEVFLMR